MTKRSNFLLTPSNISTFWLLLSLDLNQSRCRGFQIHSEAFPILSCIVFYIICNEKKTHLGLCTLFEPLIYEKQSKWNPIQSIHSFIYRLCKWYELMQKYTVVCFVLLGFFYFIVVFGLDTSICSLSFSVFHSIHL